MLSFDIVQHPIYQYEKVFEVAYDCIASMRMAFVVGVFPKFSCSITSQPVSDLALNSTVDVRMDSVSRLVLGGVETSNLRLVCGVVFSHLVTVPLHGLVFIEDMVLSHLANDSGNALHSLHTLVVTLNLVPALNRHFIRHRQHLRTSHGRRYDRSCTWGRA